MFKFQISLVFIFFTLVSCIEPKTEKKEEAAEIINDSLIIDTLIPELPPETQKEISALEMHLIEEGLVNIRQLDSSICVDLKYSTEDNFLGEDVYGDLNDCYLQPEVAQKLLLAQGFLKEEFPGFNLLVFDGVRPRSIQWKMWESLEMADKEKIKYVSNPRFGSLHNFGAAVDVSVVDESGTELDMGTAFDCFGELAYPVKEDEFKKNGKLSEKQIENRKFLRKIMYRAGFFNIQTEWWHFNSCYRKEAIKKYKLIE